MNNIFFATFVKRISLGWKEDFVFHYSTPALLNFEGKEDLHGLWRPCAMEQDFFDSRPKILVSGACANQPLLQSKPQSDMKCLFCFYLHV